MKHNSLRSSERLQNEKEKIVKSLKLPRDTMLGEAIITITGRCEVFIENYKGILLYSDERIILQGKKCKIDICGKCLDIIYYTNEDMKIHGNIECVHFV